jgi:hypothetical protein
MGKLYLLNTVLRTRHWVYFKDGTKVGSIYAFLEKKNISMLALRVNIKPNFCCTRYDFSRKYKEKLRSVFDQLSNL